MLRLTLLASALLIATSGAAMATTFHFTKDPFAGTPVLNIPGRQIVGGEQFLPGFSPATDVVSFDAPGFGMKNPVVLGNGLAADFTDDGRCRKR